MGHTLLMMLSSREAYPEDASCVTGMSSELTKFKGRHRRSASITSSQSFSNTFSKEINQQFQEKADKIVVIGGNAPANTKGILKDRKQPQSSGKRNVTFELNNNLPHYYPFEPNTNFTPRRASL